MNRLFNLIALLLLSTAVNAQIIFSEKPGTGELQYRLNGSATKPVISPSVLEGQVAQVAILDSLPMKTGAKFPLIDVRDNTRGGRFSYDASISTFDNVVTFPASGGGGFSRQYDGPVQSKWIDLSGTDGANAAKLQAAINSYPNFEFSAKVHTVTSLIISSAVHVTAKTGAVLKQAPGQTSPLLQVISDNVTIENLTLEGNKTAQTDPLTRGIQTNDGVKNLTITYCHFQNIYGEAIRLNGTTNARILYNDFTNCNQPGNTAAIVARSEFANTAALQIIGNYLDQRLSQNGGIKVQSVHPLYYSEGVNVNQNQVLMGEVTSAEALGIEFYAGYSPNNSGRIRNFTANGNIIKCLAVTLSGSTPRAKYAYGISCGAQPTTDTTGLSNGTLNGNTIDRCQRLSLELLGNNLSAVGNTIINSAEISLNSANSIGGLKNVVINGNTIRNGQGLYGIRVQTGLYPVWNVSVDGNNFFEGNKGIFFIGSDLAPGNGKFYNTSANNNKFFSLRNHAIELDDSNEMTDFSANGNQVYYDTAYANVRGIYLAARSLQSGVVNNNTLYCADNVTVMWGINHLDLTGNHQVTISSNIIAGFRSGMSSSGAATSGLTITNNQVRDGSNYGLAVSGSPTNVLVSTNSYENCAQNESVSSTAVLVVNTQKISTITNGPGTSVTSGTLTASYSEHAISSATDTDVTTIIGGSTPGQRLTLYPTGNGIKYTFKSTGNMRLAGNFIMDANSDRLDLSYNGTNWIELSRSNNNGSPTLSAPYSSTANPTTTDIVSSFQTWWRNSTNGHIINWYNNSGSMVPLNYEYGSQTFTGDGIVTSFVINHGLDHVPTDYAIDRRSVAAAPCYSAGASSTTLTITCPTAPASGASVIIGWRAK